MNEKVKIHYKNKQKYAEKAMIDGKKKARIFLAIIYPETAPDDWEEVLADGSIMPKNFWILHDNDKAVPHVHVLLFYPHNSTYQAVRNMVKKRFGSPDPLIGSSIPSAYSYFLHRKQPDKCLYDCSKVVINGFSPAEFAGCMTTDDKAEIHGRIFQYINEHQIAEFSDLAESLFHENRTLYEVVCKNHGYWDKIIRSKRFKARDEANQERQLLAAERRKQISQSYNWLISEEPKNCIPSLPEEALEELAEEDPFWYV